MKQEEIIELVLKEAGYTFHHDTPATRTQGLPQSYVTWHVRKEPNTIEEFTEGLGDNDDVKVFDPKTSEWTIVKGKDFKLLQSK